jgi:cytochrome c553
MPIATMPPTGCRRMRVYATAGAAALVLSLAGLARAQDGGNVATGGTSNSAAEQAQTCDVCHGEKGVPIDNAIPVIWGQKEGYLYLELRDFKSGARKSDIMSPIAQSLQHDDMLALAAFFAGKKWPYLNQPPAPADVVAKAGRANTAVGCTGCHQGQYQGEGTQPRLADQRRDYLEREMLAFRDGSRGNNPGMTDLMKAISKDDITALAQYLAGF